MTWVFLNDISWKTCASGWLVRFLPSVQLGNFNAQQEATGYSPHLCKTENLQQLSFNQEFLTDFSKLKPLAAWIHAT